MAKQKDHDAVALGRLRGNAEKGKTKKSPHKTNKFIPAVNLGQKGGKAGGPVRAKVLSAKRRMEIAKQGGKAKARKK